VSNEPLYRHVTADEAKNLGPVVAGLLREAPAKWSPRDEAAMTAEQERALYLLVAAAFVERRLRLRVSMATAESSIEAAVTATGVRGLEEAIQPLLAKAWAKWRDDWSEWSTGEARNTSPFAVERLRPDEWRLTAEGKVAQADIVDGDEGPIDFVLWRGRFDGRPRWRIGGEMVQRKHVAGQGDLESLNAVEPLPSVNVANWSDGAVALADPIAAAVAAAVEAAFKKQAEAAGHGQLTATPAVVDDVHAKLARRLQGNARAVLLYLASRRAVCADTARTRDCIAAGLTAAGVTVSENTPKNAVASLRAQGEAVGLNLVESGDSGSWLPPDGQRVAALVPATVGTHAAPILTVRGG
jgi:hypothetical protein